MKLPFNVEQFFGIFARYNQVVWPMQIVLIVFAILVILMLFSRSYITGRLIMAILTFFWAWMAIAYHFAFFTVINPAAWIFGTLFLGCSLWFAWTGIIKNMLKFSFNTSIRACIGGLLIIYSLIIYPLLGFIFGHRYPAVPTFGLPCPTTIFTLGILLFAVAPFPRSVFIVPVLWSIIGSFAAFQLKVPQDYGLLIAGVIGLIFAVLPSKFIMCCSGKGRC